MYFDYSVIKQHRLYPFVVPVLKLLSHIVYSTKCAGIHNVPESGKLIIACNHIAFSDPALIVAYCPRTVHFMAKSELFEMKAKAWLMRNMNAFPVKRNTSDRMALSYSKKILEKDWVLGIFPEGRRVKESKIPTQGKTGVAFLCRMSGADVLPVCIHKTYDGFIRPRVKIRFGKVIRNEDLGFANIDRNEELRKATDKIMDAVKLLWEEENADKGC